MARSRRALTLVSALAVVFVARAAGQPVPPTPASLPDPAAVLLPPVESAPPAVRVTPVRSDSALPVADSVRDDPPPFRDPPRQREPAARIRWDDGPTTRVRAVDYEESQRTSTTAAPDAGRRDADPYEYLTGGRREHFRSSRKDDDLPRLQDPADERDLGERLGDRIDTLLGRGKSREDGRRHFESDREFANFVSPVSNPFFAEDPRSLTELRPVVIYQRIPDAQPTFRGGSTAFFGGQARLAFTPRVSVVVNKVGFSQFNPGSAAAVRGGNGLSEFWLGPKVVVYRDPQFQSLISVGTTFQIPLGAEGPFQNTGRLSVVPYVSAGQKLMSTAWGTFQGQASGGYSFGTTRDRSDFFFASAHLDFDIMNQHRFYPLAELNWFGYTTNGQARALGVEGRDLANIGAAAKGANLVTWALGGRVRSKNTFWEVGAAFEGPLVGPRDLFRYRFTIDLIWRY
jgi:hypothetical protein